MIGIDNKIEHYIEVSAVETYKVKTVHRYLNNFL